MGQVVGIGQVGHLPDFLRHPKEPRVLRFTNVFPGLSGKSSWLI